MADKMVGMAEFPKLSPPIEGDFDAHTPAREQSPFYPSLPTIVDAKTLQEAISKNPQFIFQTICDRCDELKIQVAKNDQLRADIDHYREELTIVRENWMDSNQTLIVTQTQLSSIQDQLKRVQEQLTNAHHQISTTQQQLMNAQSQLKAVQDEGDLRVLDWTTRAQRYEELLAIGSAKQVVLWKYIERLQEGVPPGPRGNENIPIPAMTGTHFTPGPPHPMSPQSDHSNSTVTEFKGSPVRSSLVGSPERGRSFKQSLEKESLTGSPERSGFQGGLETDLITFSPEKDSVQEAERGSLARSPERVGGFNPNAVSSRSRVWSSSY